MDRSTKRNSVSAGQASQSFAKPAHFEQCCAFCPPGKPCQLRLDRRETGLCIMPDAFHHARRLECHATAMRCQARTQYAVCRNWRKVFLASLAQWQSNGFVFDNTAAGHVKPRTHRRRLAMKAYTTKDLASVLPVDEKIFLRLCHRKLLTPISGFRHKRFTEEEVKR
jgi:hypothetical protein